MNSALACAAVVVRRTIAAPPDIIFDAWLDPIALATWMRPGTIRSTAAEVDARVGGRYRITMHGDEDYPHHGVYRVIDRPRKLVFTWISNATEQRESLVTVDFFERDGRTEVIVTHEQLPDGAPPSHRAGWESGLTRLVELFERSPRP